MSLIIRILFIIANQMSTLTGSRIFYKLYLRALPFLVPLPILLRRYRLTLLLVLLLILFLLLVTVLVGLPILAPLIGTF